MPKLAYPAAFLTTFLIAFAVGCAQVQASTAQAEDDGLAKDATLAALIDGKCAEGCAVMNAADLEALQDKIRELAIAAHKHGELSCRNAI